ncbi:MAG: RecX family transcriptional regulator [Treponema sp.]|jgi:regulatory protein|nr:RecX family transcriptional regulator [Treponema sp.]
MTVVSVKTGADPETERIEFSDGSILTCRKSYLPPSCRDKVLSLPGAELEPGSEEALRFAAACFRAERAALRLISRAEQTVFGISRKLERRGHAPGPVQAAVSRLTDLDLLNDKRYALRWIQSRLSRGAEGPLKLIRGLCGRGIDRDAAAAALKAALDFEGEMGLLRRYLAKKFPAFDGGDGEQYLVKQKLKLAGFSGPVIRAFWEEL